jgi:hypothetical protein
MAWSSTIKSISALALLLASAAAATAQSWPNKPIR